MKNEGAHEAMSTHQSEAGPLHRLHRSPLRFGVSFSNLDVHGFNTSLRFQPTVVSYALALPRFLISVASRHAHRKVQILQGFNGVIHQGEMLLVLGRPGSGCTSFLKALAGDTCGIVINDTAAINYQGVDYKQMHSTFKGESIYLAELDVHFPELTLGQTLAFAASIRQSGQDRSSVSSKISREACKLFGLEKAFDTWIGNTVLHGISGGEKRRTSIAEALVGGATLQFWDNSTRGLDSSTAFNFVQYLRQSTTEENTAVAVSIYQASEAIYKKFDKVTLLYEGRQIYFGPIALAAQYFVDLGFERNSRITTPDFLTSITNTDERVVRQGYEDRAPRTPDEFSAAWKRSTHFVEAKSEVDKFNATYPCSNDTLLEASSLRKATYFIPMYLQVVSCIQRGIQRLINQPAPVIGSIVANAILALVVGSVYYQLKDDSQSMDRRAILIFFSLLVTAYSPAFEVLTIWAQRPIVEKHDRYAFYHPFTDAVASMICDLPNKFLTALLFQITIYFMTKLRLSVSAFFIWFLFNFVLVLNMSMWFRLIGSVARTMEQSTAPTCIMVLLSCIYAGFIVPVPYMVGWLKWFRFVNPIAYTYESLLINEMSNRRFTCTELIPAGPQYAEIELSHRICPTVGAVAGQNYVDGNAYLAEKLGFEPSNLWRNLGILVGMTVIVCAFHMLAAQTIPAERSQGDILRFRRQYTNEFALLDEEHEATVFAQDMKKIATECPRNHGKRETSVDQVIAKQSMMFHWSDLCYDVKTGNKQTKRILEGISGWVKPGTITALMGVTGAGKTTLMDFLANRANSGIPSGKVYVGGNERAPGFQRQIGYAQQEDIHSPTTTVREALEFSALLRQTGASRDEKLSYVDNVIEILDMSSYAEAIVGVPGDGLNIEQRKRLTIGVELVAKPELLLFLDEPTSGLDSQTAWSICTLLRKLASNGQGILCTIHQPSAELFCMFDRLLLLNNQGQTIYFGDIGSDASSLISYLETNGAQKCMTNDNPAEWMLNETNKAANMDSGDSPQQFWSKKWMSSPEKREVDGQLATLQSLPATTVSQKRQREFSASWFQQLMVVTERLFRNYWRSPVYLYSKLALCAGVAVFNGLSFQNTVLDMQGLQNIIFSIFLLTQMFGTVDQQVIPRFIDERQLFESRESRSKTYSWSVMLSSNILVEAAWQSVAGVLVFVAWYYPTGLWRNGDTEFGTVERGALVFLIIWMYCLWISTFSQAMAAFMEYVDSAVQLATLLFWFSLLFCGVMVSPSNLPGFWKFVWRASPLTYLVGGLASAGLSHANITCSSVEMLTLIRPNESISCGQYMTPFVQIAGGYVENQDAYSDCRYCPMSNADIFLYDTVEIPSGSPWKSLGYFTVFVVFNVVATFGLYWVARVPKKHRA